MADTDSGAGTKARKWQTKSLAHFPILLVLSLLVSVIAVCAAVALLVIADGSPIDSWPVAPAVILSILVTISNTMLRYAFSEGSELYWWSKLLSPSGVRLADLHTTWEISHSALSLLQFPARRARQYPLRLSAFLVMLLAASGPLLQRAVTVESTTRLRSLETTLPIRRRPMWNLTSKPSFDEWTTSLLLYQPEIQKLASELNLRQPMALSSPVCQLNATCTTNVTIAGFGWDCVDKEVDPWNITSLPVARAITSTTYDGKIKAFSCENTGFRAAPNASQIDYKYYSDDDCGNLVSDAQMSFIPGLKAAILDGVDILGTDTEIPYGQFPAFEYTTYLRKDHTTQKLSVRQCNFTTSFIQLPIRIVDEKVVTIVQPSKDDSELPLRKSRHDIERISFGQDVPYTGPLIDAFGQIMSDMYSGYILFNFMRSTNLALGASMRQYINQSSIMMRDRSNYRADLGFGVRGYGFTMLDPFDDFVATLNEVCLRYAIKSIDQSVERLQEHNKYLREIFRDTDPQQVLETAESQMLTSFSEQQRVRMEESFALAVYKSNYVYLAAAAGIIYLAVLSTLLLLRKVFFSHGRTFSLSPLEVAKAFNAPLLTDVGSNLEVGDIVESLTDVQVRYGEAVGDTKSSREDVNEHGRSSLSLGASTGVSDDSRMLAREEALRLRIDLADCVSKPVRGRSYY